MSEKSHPEAVLSVRGLSKTYRVGFFLARQVKALDGLDLDISKGQVYGLLGPNGAGKSTTIKILMNLVRKSSGTALILGRPPDDAEVRRTVGFVPENPSPYAYLTGREFVSLSARLAGLSGQDLDKRLKEVIGMVEMTRAQDLQIRRYSKGMVQRITLAQALIASPKFLVLDEPTSGLDPVGRQLIRDIILAERERGTTVLFCTHIIPDVEALCDRIAVLVGGKRVREGRVQELLTQGASKVEMVIEGMDQAALSDCGVALESVRVLDQRLLVICAESDAQGLLRNVVAKDGRVARLTQARFGLEDLFMTAVREASGRSVGGDITE